MPAQVNRCVYLINIYFVAGEKIQYEYLRKSESNQANHILCFSDFYVRLSVLANAHIFTCVSRGDNFLHVA